MILPTDDEIFSYMMREELLDECEKCNGDIKDVCCGFYTTYECLNCGYMPEPQEEV